MASIEIGDGDALVVIDVQNDFCPGGALAIPEGDKVVAPINRLMAAFPIVAMSQDWHPPGHKSFASAHPGKSPFETTKLSYGEQMLWPDHCVEGTEGAAFHPDLEVDRVDVIVRKGVNPEIDSYSTFFENDKKTSTGLAGYLREKGVRRIFLTGLVYEYCVGFSAHDGAEQGFEVVVVEDATGVFGNALNQPMTDRLTAAGATFATTADILG